MDCHGCEGGLIHKLFKYHSNTTSPKALATLASYPYIAEESYCKESGYGTKYGVRLTNWKGYYNATGMSESYILSGLKTGVIGGAVYCDETLWYAYTSGILTYDQCKPPNNEINHAVTICGYGVEVETGMKYWVIANTWSTLWGEKGFIKLERVDPKDTSRKAGTCNLNVYIAYSFGT